MRTTAPGRLVMLVAITMTTMGLGAQEALHLDFAQAWDLARARNPDLVEDYLELRKAASLANEVASAFIPDISLALGLERSAPYLPKDGPATTEAEHWILEGRLSASVDLGPAQFTGQEREKILYRIAEAEYRAQESALYVRLLKLWLGIEHSRAELAIREKELATVRTRMERAQTQYQQGLLSQTDVLSSRISVARLGPVIERLRTKIVKDLRDLERMTGHDSGRPLVLEPLGARVPDASSVDAGALRMRLEANHGLRTSVVRQELASLDRERAVFSSQGIKPSAGLSLGLGWDETIASLQNGYKLDRQKFSDNLTLSFGLSIPLSSYIPGSTGALDAQDARDTEASAGRDLARTRQDLEDEFAALLLDIGLAEGTRELNQLSLSLQRQYYDVATSAYQAGTKSLLDLDEAAQALSDAELAVREGDHALLLLAIDLEALLGGFPRD